MVFLIITSKKIWDLGFDVHTFILAPVYFVKLHKSVFKNIVIFSKSK